VWSCHGGLLRNGRAGKPLAIADQTYQRGLLAHAPSKVVVQLASPGKKFSVIVGLDSNEQTRPGLGSVVFSVTVGGKFVLRGCKGDSCTPDSYQPYAIALGRDESHSSAPPGGRPTEVAFPYYNLTMPGGGLIVALGWPGQRWSPTTFPGQR
jgi:hypothetical protein